MNAGSIYSAAGQPMSPGRQLHRRPLVTLGNHVLVEARDAPSRCRASLARHSQVPPFLTGRAMPSPLAPVFEPVPKGLRSGQVRAVPMPDGGVAGYCERNAATCSATALAATGSSDARKAGTSTPPGSVLPHDCCPCQQSGRQVRYFPPMPNSWNSHALMRAMTS